MAILKIISHGKTSAGTRRLLSYVLAPQKTEPHLCAVSGDFQGEEITPNTVFQSFNRIRQLFGKERKGSRTYTHGTISFAPGEATPNQVAEFASEFVEQAFPGYQALTAVHTDTEHVHAHFVIEPVSYINGIMLHTSKSDLECAKSICNDMCRSRSLSVASKGRHADGTAFSEGEITAWTKDKWHQMSEDPKQSYLVALALAVQDCAAAACSKEEFCDLLEHEYGWSVTWSDTKKNITFFNSEGKRVRASNISKTFNLDISKESFQYEFARNIGRTDVKPSVASEAAKAEQTNRATGNREPVVTRTTGKHHGKGR